MINVTEGAGELAVDIAGLAVLVQPRFWIGEGILRITDRTQRLVAYLDQIERCLGGELVLGNHGGDWI
ncbi:MAG: hypothetical protein V3S21_09570, partial [Xanthomonadales bacterium]